MGIMANGGGRKGWPSGLVLAEAVCLLVGTGLEGLLVIRGEKGCLQSC